MPFASIRSFINRSSATTTAARFKLYSNMRESTRAENDFSANHPAAIASSGLRSIDQNTRLLALLGTAKLERKEIRGGDVIARTTSKCGSNHKRKAQLAINVPKSIARRHFEALPNPVDPIRMILTSFQVSRLAKPSTWIVVASGTAYYRDVVSSLRQAHCQVRSMLSG